MVAYIATRLARTVIMLLGLSLIVFLLFNLAGDPAAIISAPDATDAQLAAVRHDLGLDKPLAVRYLTYMSHTLVGDFGRSWKYQQPAMGLVTERLPATLELAIAAIILAVVMGGGLGILAAIYRGSVLDSITVSVSIIVRSIPTFWLGLMLILLFAVTLGWLPTSGRGTPLQLVLPAVTLSTLFIGDVLLLTRSQLIEVLEENYIRTARAKGLSERWIIVVHALGNAALPVVSVIGVTFAQLLGGSVVVEAVFSWPGVGSVAVEGVSLRDFTLVQASVFVLALSIAMVSLAMDASYAILDPRTRRR